MKASGGTPKLFSSAKRILDTNSPTLQMETRNVQSADFTILSQSRKSLPLSNKVSRFDKGKSSSTLERIWKNDDLTQTKVPRTLSVGGDEFFLDATEDAVDVQTSDSDMGDEFSQKKIEEFRKQREARRNRLKGLEDNSQAVRVEISSEDEDIPSDQFKSRLTSTILGKSSGTHVSDSQGGSLSQSRPSLAGGQSFSKGAAREVSRWSNSKRPKENIQSGQSSQHQIDLEDYSDDSQPEDIQVPKVVPRVSREKMLQVKLEKEDIRNTKRKYCCKQSCLGKLGGKLIRETRENYFRQDSQHRPSSLQWLVQGKEDERDGHQDGGRYIQKNSRGRFRIKGHPVCRIAFKAVFCISNNLLQRLQGSNNASLYSPRLGGRPLSNATCVVTTWMKNFFETHCESLPNKDIVHLPDNFSKFKVWNLYKSTYQILDRDSSVSYRTWCKLWSRNFAHVKIPVVNRFSVCADCEEFKSIREKAVSPEEKRKTTLAILKMLFVFYFV